MLKTLAIANYRSLLDLAVPLGAVNLVTGPNGSGKSNLYRALRLLAETARDGGLPNEPETSLHPGLLPALARPVVAASERSQVWVVSHAPRLVRALAEHPECNSIRLEKALGATRVEGQAPLEAPPWKWPED